MSEIKLKLEPRSLFGAVVVVVGVVLIVHSAYIAVLGIGDIETLITQTITYDEAFLGVMAWFFGLLIEVIGGFFLGIIGTKVIKK